MLQSIHKPAFIISILLGLYLKFMLLPTANGAFELYHVTHIDAIYHLYSALKVLEIVFNGWPYQEAACVLISSVVYLVWQRLVNKNNTTSAL